MAHDVFISYASSDKTVAFAACAALENAKIRCWIAPRDIIAGREYGDAILDAIFKSKILVLVFSANANDSPQVRREVERAVSKGKIILPFRIEDVLPSRAMEYCLGNTHWLDALTPPLEKHLCTLVENIRTLLRKQTAESQPTLSQEEVSYIISLAYMEPLYLTVSSNSQRVPDEIYSKVTGLMEPVIKGLGLAIGPLPERSASSSETCLAMFKKIKSELGKRSKRAYYIYHFVSKLFYWFQAEEYLHLDKEQKALMERAIMEAARGAEAIDEYSNGIIKAYLEDSMPLEKKAEEREKFKDWALRKFSAESQPTLSQEEVDYIIALSYVAPLYLDVSSNSQRVSDEDYAKITGLMEQAIQGLGLAIGPLPERSTSSVETYFATSKKIESELGKRSKRASYMYHFMSKLFIWFQASSKHLHLDKEQKALMERAIMEAARGAEAIDEYSKVIIEAYLEDSLPLEKRAEEQEKFKDWARRKFSP